MLKSSTKTIFLLLFLTCAPIFGRRYGSYFVCNETVQDVDPNLLCRRRNKPRLHAEPEDCSICLDIDESRRNHHSFPVRCGGPCKNVVRVTWHHPEADICKSPCNESVTYQKCQNDDQCPTGFCCSRPTRQVLQASTEEACGPPSICSCPDHICTADCAPLINADGFCMRSDILPGYSCSNDPCQDVGWVYDICGYDGIADALPPKACTNDCELAVFAIRSCEDDPLVKLRTYKWKDENCRGCEGYLYKRCSNNSECPEGTCCALPMNPDLDSCGPPAYCLCEEGNNGIPNIICTEDCGDPRLGTCEEMGGIGRTNFFNKACSICPDLETIEENVTLLLPESIQPSQPLTSSLRAGNKNLRNQAQRLVRP
jgi:hypothetical protein